MKFKAITKNRKGRVLISLSSDEARWLLHNLGNAIEEARDKNAIGSEAADRLIHQLKRQTDSY